MRSRAARHRVAWAGLLLVPALLLACALDGGSRRAKEKEKRRTVLLSTEYDDERVGDESAIQLEAQMGLYRDPELEAYVAEVGRRLVAYAPSRPFQYKFKIVDQMMPNAFALPGGHIYVSRGLLALTNDEDELAGVLGHEIIHAAERHAASMQELGRRQNPLMMPVMRMMEMAQNSRQHEDAADRGGQAIAARAGYDPMGLARFLGRLGDMERLQLGYSRIASYFDTHPGTTERVSTATARATSMVWKPNPVGLHDRRRYFEKLDGLILGENPVEGVFRDNVFLHPDLDFRIIFPRGWQLTNSPTAVGAIAPNGAARIFLSASGPSPSPREAAEAFAADNEQDFVFNVKKSGPIKLGEIDAWRLDVEGRIGRMAVSGQLTFFSWRGLTFRLTGVAPGAQWGRYVGRARTTARSFRGLTPAERSQVQVLRLRSVAALGGESLADLSDRTGNAWNSGQTAVLNGTFVDTRFAPGDHVKIARASSYVPPPPPREPQDAPPARTGRSPGEGPPAN